MPWDSPWFWVGMVAGLMGRAVSGHIIPFIVGAAGGIVVGEVWKLLVWALGRLRGH